MNKSTQTSAEDTGTSQFKLAVQRPTHKLDNSLESLKPATVATGIIFKLISKFYFFIIFHYILIFITSTTCMSTIASCTLGVRLKHLLLG